MARILIGLVALLALVGCSPAVQPKPVTAKSIALQPGDVAGLRGCDAGGDMQTVLSKEKTIDTFLYDQNATEWQQWKTQGATEAYFAVYGRTAADCEVFSATGNGAPHGGLMAGLVVKFKDTSASARNYRLASTLLGFGPRDITFIKLVGGVITTGTDTGLGPQSVIGTASAVGSTY
jgi:hypothetical protein